MKTILQSCLRLWSQSGANRECRGRRSTACPTFGHSRHHEPCEQSAGHQARCGLRVSEQRRRQMILDTERYLSNPRSKAWSRSTGLTCTDLARRQNDLAAVA